MSFDSPHKLTQVLKNQFGHDEFRGMQRSIIESALGGKSSLVVMPTGMGKSLCYQLPSQCIEGLVLVISPLIALMKDQVDAAQKKGLDTCFINSSLDTKGRESRYQKLKEGTYDLIYVTPERFRKEKFLEALSKRKVSLLAIDEAHCISMWGHDFRPDYSRMAEIRAVVGSPPTMALTATATQQVQEDILKQLGLAKDSVKIFVDGFERPNLVLRLSEVYGWEEKVRHLVGLRYLHQGAAIVYFSLVSTLQQVSHELQRLSIDHLIYHGQQSDFERKRSQEEFLESDKTWILATPAFGLGVDKPNIRLVIHAEIPGSMEAYYQEIGRSGRDGKTAHCHLLYDGDNISTQMDFIKWSNPDPGFICGVYNLLKRWPDKVAAEGLNYLRGQMNFYNRRDFRVETSLNLLERWDCIKKIGSFRYEIQVEPPREFLSEDGHRDKMQTQHQKLLKMVEYTRLDSCRKNYIYKYFGQREIEDCGLCDICQGQGEV